MASSYHDLVEKQRAYWLTGATLPLEARRQTLETLKKMFVDHKDDFAEAAFKDIHRSPKANFELATVFGQIEELLAHLDEWAAPTKYPAGAPHNPKEDTVIVTREPFGVVLVISPWNVPLWTSAPLIHALAAGNTVILKPSELAPHFSETIDKFAKQYFKEELFTVVQGAVAETTELLKERFDYICYTGNPPVGKIIMAAAAKHLTPVTLELGGKAPILVLPDANIAEAAEKTVKGKLLICGQACIGPDYFLVTPEVKPKLIEAVKAVLEKIGDLTDTPLYERIINERHFDRITNLIAKTKGKLVAKGNGEVNKADLFIPPHVYDVEHDDFLLQDEIFGPLLPIVTVPDFEAALRYVKTHEKPLGAYVFTSDPEKARRFIVETSSGGVTVNDVMQHGFASGVHFGGVGNSGMGRVLGKHGFNTFTHEKPVLVRSALDVKL